MVDPELSALIADLQRAVEPSRRLDMLIYRHLYPQHWAMIDPGGVPEGRGSSWDRMFLFPIGGWPMLPREGWEPWREAADYHNVPDYTGSLDAAFDLAERFQRGVRSVSVDRCLQVSVVTVENGPWGAMAPTTTTEKAATACCAILAAMLSASPTPSTNRTTGGGHHPGPKD